MPDPIGRTHITQQYTFDGNNTERKISGSIPLVQTGSDDYLITSGTNLLLNIAKSHEHQIISDIDQRPEVYSHAHFFDPKFYATQNPDLANHGITTEAQLKDHWLTYGINEERQGSPDFNAKWYLSHHSDLGKNGIKTTEDAIRHYADHGRFEGSGGRKTSSLTSDVALSQDLDMDIYQPANPEEKKVPVVINLVGGGWASAEKDHPAMQTMGKDFAKNGIAMISPEYHTAPSHTYPAQMQDIDSVLKYVKDHAEENNWDLDNITLAGGSAGGHLALQHTMNPKFDNHPELPKIKNVIGIAPGTDLAIDLDDQQKEGISNFLGRDYETKVQEASPITYANLSSDKRFYISYGLQDTTTPPDSQALPFISQMDAAGQDITIDIHSDGAHGDWQVPSDEHYDPEFVFNMSQWIKEA